LAGEKERPPGFFFDLTGMAAGGGGDFPETPRRELAAGPAQALKNSFTLCKRQIFEHDKRSN
jgi:hypothetical protein